MAAVASSTQIAWSPICWVSRPRNCALPKVALRTTFMAVLFGFGGAAARGLAGLAFPVL